MRTTAARVATSIALTLAALSTAAAEAAPGTGPDNVVWAKTTGLSATEQLSHLQVARYDGDNLQSTNVARAESTDCTDCRTVAVAVQAVFVTANPHTVAPMNAALALNLRCLRCTTYAFAYQYVVSTNHRFHLSGRARKQVSGLRRAISNVAQSDLAPAEMDSRLTVLTAEFKADIDADLKRQHEHPEDRNVDLDDNADGSGA